MDPKPEPQPEPQPDPQPEPEPHGKTVNAYKYQRDIDAKNKRIEELEANLAANDGSNAKVKELEAKLDGFLSDQATEKTNAALKQAGCIDVKAAGARLDEFEGDIKKLKTECPYLFKTKGTQSTGGQPQGTPEADDERLNKFRRLMGLKEKKD